MTKKDLDNTSSYPMYESFEHLIFEFSICQTLNEHIKFIPYSVNQCQALWTRVST